MKTLKHILLASSLFTLASCSDFLDKAPDDMLDLEMIFNDKVRTEDWLAGVYTNIPSQRNFMDQEGALSDDQNPSIGWLKFGWGVIEKQTGNWNPNSGDSRGYWDNLPNVSALL